MAHSKHHLSSALENMRVVRVSVLAVQGAMLALAASAAGAANNDPDAEIKALTHFTNKVEFGVGHVDRGSYKFGEYNGLQRSGAFGNAGFELGGGDDYTKEGAFRWRASGTDLGLDIRSLDVDVAQQGKYRLIYSYDELRRNFSDSYQTPYQGVGTSTLTLPNYPAAGVRGSGTNTAATALANWQNLQSPNAVAGVAGGGPGYLIPAMMRNANIDTRRKKHGIDFTAILSSEWQLTAAAHYEEKDGTKLTGTAFGGPIRGAMLAEPVDSATYNYRATLQYASGRNSLSLGYAGSLYKNHINTWTAANPYNGALLNTTFNDAARLVGAPDNQMHRFSLSGSYGFSPTTRLTMSGHYTRMTQNEAFAGNYPTAWTVPVTSANAKVVDAHFNATLTARPTRDLALVARYKYEDRDSQTPIYNIATTPGNAAGTATIYNMRPLNRRSQQLDLEGDYAVARRQAIKFGYEYQMVDRTADGSDTPFRRETTRDNTLRLEYRNNVSATVNGRIGYSYSQRRGSDYALGALIPTVVPGQLPSSSQLTDFKQFYLADRNRDKLRSVLNYQATDRLSLQTGLDYNKDDYSNSPYGLKKADSWVFKLDGAYLASEALSINAYYTYESIRSHVESLAIGRATATTVLSAPVATATCTGYFVATGAQPANFGSDPCRWWAETQTDKVHTLGFGAKASNLMSGKLEVTGDIAWSRARTPIDAMGGAYFGNGSTAAAPTFNNVWLPAESFPAISSTILDVRLAGKYTLDKNSSVRVNYLYRRLKGNDWQYDAFTNSALGAVAIQNYVGTGMTADQYTVQVLGVTYIYSFQ